MKVYLLIAILIFIPFAASASDPHKWTWEDTTLQTIYTGITTADWMQTLHMARDIKNFRYDPTRWNTYYYEHSSTQFLGKFPTKRKINIQFTTSLIGHASISYLLPKPYRTIWQASYIAYEYDAVQDNRKIGLGIHLHF